MRGALWRPLLFYFIYKIKPFIFCYDEVNKINKHNPAFYSEVLRFTVNKVQLNQSNKKNHHGYSNRKLGNECGTR